MGGGRLQISPPFLDVLLQITLRCAGAATNPAPCHHTERTPCPPRALSVCRRRPTSPHTRFGNCDSTTLAFISAGDSPRAFSLLTRSLGNVRFAAKKPTESRSGRCVRTRGRRGRQGSSCCHCPPGMILWVKSHPAVRGWSPGRAGRSTRGSSQTRRSQRS